MLKIQMLEQIMNNENSDDECEKSQVDDNEPSGHVEYFLKRRSSSIRWVHNFHACFRRLIRLVIEVKELWC